MWYRKTLLLLTLGAWLAAPAAAYTIYLKDGSKIIAQSKYTIDGEKAIITLESGTQTFLAFEEIDVARTDQANQSASLGNALIFEDGRFVERTDTETARVEIDTVTDLIARGAATIRGAESVEAGVSNPEETFSVGTTGEPSPLRNIELAAALKSAFSERGVGGVAIFQGSASRRARIELTTNSEASVFRGLEVASEVLLGIQEAHGDACQLFELSMMTSNRQRAGDFELTPEMAESIRSKEIEVSAFFVDNVRF